MTSNWQDSEVISRHHPNLDDFFTRVEYSGSREPTLKLLQTLQYLFQRKISFENLLLHGWTGNPPAADGVPVNIEPNVIENKVIERKRGGYCFELNQYWFMILRELGYDIVTKVARSVRGLPVESLRARTHLIAIVTLHGVRYITDVAFATATPVMPINMDIETPQTNGFETIRVVHPGSLYPKHHYLLQSRDTRAVEEAWVNRYIFDSEELSHFTDWECGNWFVCTRPTMLPVTQSLVTNITEHGRCWLVDNKLIEFKFKNNESLTDIDDVLSRNCPLEIDYIETTLTTLSEYLSVLSRVFDLNVPKEYIDKLKIPGINK